MIVGKGPCVLLQPGRVLEHLGSSTSQQRRLAAALADGEQDRGRSIQHGLCCGAAWWRLLDAPSAPCFHLRPAQGSTELLNTNHTGPDVSWPAELLVQMLANASSCVLLGAVC